MQQTVIIYKRNRTYIGTPSLPLFEKKKALRTPLKKLWTKYDIMSRVFWERGGKAPVSIEEGKWQL